MYAWPARGGFVTRNLPVRHSARAHLATVPLANSAHERDTRVLFSVAGEGTCHVVTILFPSSFTVLRWPPRKLEPTRPLVTANRFRTVRRASSFATLADLAHLSLRLIIIIGSIAYFTPVWMSPRSQQCDSYARALASFPSRGQETNRLRDFASRASYALTLSSLSRLRAFLSKLGVIQTYGR